jgi:hypothetical protein
MKRLILIAVMAVTLFSAPRATVYASTVSWTALTASNAFALANGTTALPSNDVLWIGMFTMSDSVIHSFQDNILGALTNFTLFGAGVIGTGNAGGYNGVFDIASANADSVFASKQIYLLAFNVGPTFNVTNSLQWAAITSPSWQFPSDYLSGVTGFDMETLSTIVVGSAGGAINLGQGQYSLASVALHQIPEPSAFVLVGMGLAGAFLLRRRRT